MLSFPMECFLFVSSFSSIANGSWRFFFPVSPDLLPGGMDVDPPAFIHGEPMEIDSPAILPLALGRQERLEATQVTMHLLTLEDRPPVVDFNHGTELAPVVDLPTRLHDAVPSPIVQSVENAEVAVQSNREDRHERREGGDREPQSPRVVTPTTLENGEGAPAPINRQDEFIIINAGRLLQFKDYYVEDLTNRMQRLKITDDPGTTDPVYILELPGPCSSAPTASVSVSPMNTTNASIPPDNDTNGVTDTICIPELPVSCSPDTASVLPMNNTSATEASPDNDINGVTTIATETPLDTDTSDFTDTGRIPELPLPCTSVPSVNTTTATEAGVPAGQSLHIFSNLERPFDEKNFSALEGYVPNHHSTQDARPSSKEWPLGRFDTFEERLKAKRAQRKQKDDSPTFSETHIIRTRKTKTPRRHPYRFDFTPLSSTNHGPASNKDPFGKYTGYTVVSRS